jgi:hypothetical protein
MIRLHCAASPQGLPQERLETTGRRLGMRWKHPHVRQVSQSPPAGVLGIVERECGRNCFSGRRECMQPRAASGRPMPSYGASLQLSYREVYVRRDEEKDQRNLPSLQPWPLDLPMDHACQF